MYDPCTGSGGILVLNADHVQRHSGNPRNFNLYGQDNGGVWSFDTVSKINMILPDYAQSSSGLLSVEKSDPWDRKRLLNRFESGTKRRAGRQISAERLRCSSNMSLVRDQVILYRIPDTDLRNGNLVAEPLHVEGGEARKLRTVNLKHGLMNDSLTGCVRITVINEATA